MLNYLRVAKLQYSVIHDRKKSMSYLSQILEYAARVPEFQLLKLVRFYFSTKTIIGKWLMRDDVNGKRLETSNKIF